MTKIKRICFVCHGNICRSPMAQFVFNKIIIDNGVRRLFSACSKATSSEEIYRGVGNPIYPLARKQMENMGIPYDKNKRAEQLQKSDYDNYDLFVCMDENNCRNARCIFGNDKENKIVKLLDYCGGGSVADPWYSGDFSTAYSDIERGCKALLKAIMD